MSFVNSNQNLYTPPPIAPGLDFSITFGGEIRLQTQSPSSLTGRIFLRGDLRPVVRLSLDDPEPILNELNENPFSARFFTARLFDNENLDIPISSFSVDAPAGSFGKLLRVRLAKKDLSLVSPAKNYTFQLGVRDTPGGAISWKTIIQNAALDSRSFTLAWNSNQPQDTLTFGAVNPLSDRLNLYPLANQIIYDGNKQTISLDDSEIIFDESGVKVKNLLVNLPNLNLYKLLKFLIKNIGFSQFRTNIPNFEITRCDFPITSSYIQSLSGILGVFEPVFFTASNTLWILDKTSAIPEDFEPVALPPAIYSNLSLTIPQGPQLDGFLLTYTDSKETADFYEDRLVQSIEQTGVFGNTDYTRTEIAKTYRDWKNLSNPQEILRSEIVREVHSTYDNHLNLIGRETETHIFDSSGKRTNSLRTIESLIPHLGDAGNPALLTTRIETQTIFYATDPRNSRRMLQNKTVTQVRGLIAIDSENQYFDADFKQDFLEAHKAGNLTVSMTSEFGPVKTITETLTPLGNNQYQIRISSVDHLRGTTVNSVSEPKTGDAGLNALSGRGRRILILRDGLTQSSRMGRAIETFAIGELPLRFGKPLAKRVLARRVAIKQTGTITIAGFDESLDRGTFFSLKGRGDDGLGIFLTDGFSFSGDELRTPNQQIITQIQASEI